MSDTAKVTDASFYADVLKSNEPVVVDFWAEWCGPCRMIAPALEEIATELKGKVKIVKFNVDENPKVASELGIRSIPTLMVFKGGERVAHQDRRRAEERAIALDRHRDGLIGQIISGVGDAGATPAFSSAQPSSFETRRCRGAPHDEGDGLSPNTPSS